ncbi:MAG TPA: hypothetical protein P5186_28140 [Candidatus Paceibacterota bacterium]|nr:hypothetical protein [Candidatus Paceibacterota bacterium]
MINQVDAAGTTRYGFTSAGRLSSEDGPYANDTVSYSYHASVPGLRTGLTVHRRAEAPGRRAAATTPPGG